MDRCTTVLNWSAMVVFLGGVALLIVFAFLNLGRGLLRHRRRPHDQSSGGANGQEAWCVRAAGANAAGRAVPWRGEPHDPRFPAARKRPRAHESHEARQRGTLASPRS